MTYRYLCFPRLRCVEFNTVSSPHVSGVAQPTTVCGLAHATLLKLAKALEVDIDPRCGVVYGVHEFMGFLGISRNPCSTQFQRDALTKGGLAPIIDRPRATMSMSIVLEVAFNEELAAHPVNRPEISVDSKD